jgi:diguanylate cyclase (GGDEF) domain
MDSVSERKALCERFLEAAEGRGAAAEAEAMRQVEEALGPSACADLLHALTRLEFGQEEGRLHWRAIARHRQALALSLGRDVGLRVALCDYFVNVAPRVRNPVLVELRLLRRQEELALTDELTGLSNRRRLNQELEREVERFRRFGQPFSVVMLDLDRFKDFNDAHGHQAGDEALRGVAQAMLETCRVMDQASRWGGEEFVLLLPQTGKDDAVAVAERVRLAVAGRPVLFGGRDHGPVTVSAGVATFPEDAYSAEALVRRADKALYRAKAERNMVFAFREGLRRHPRLKLRLDAELRPSHGPERPCATRDLSLGGMLCEASSCLPLGAEVEIVLRDGDRRSMPLRGRALRVTPDPERPGGFILALGFDAPDSRRQDMILEFLAPRSMEAH